MGPVMQYRPRSESAGGQWPVDGSRPPLALWPQMPLKKLGFRMDPPMSAPNPIGLPPAPMMAASPPLEPPAIRRVFQGLVVRP